ncbi:MAG: fused MFS/spermidine synthase [Deltaproteobacteria bacterium]|nr:fused MFS/spermidine synthase [Deltaproteobacteria bacterium]
MGWFFLFFILSGFCGLVYQVTWLRAAMASFGVTTPMVSIVLSVFMAGLALGSFAGGRLAHRLEGRGPRPFLRLYAATELLIGVSGIVVAPLLRLGHTLFVSSGGTEWNSSAHYLAAGAWLTLALLPFCTAMGATFPLAMAGIRATHDAGSGRSFSYLYVANVLGAMAGALTSAFVLIELLGFRNTMLFASAVNVVVAVLAFAQGGKLTPAAKSAPLPRPAASAADSPEDAPAVVLFALLLATGLISLAMEVVWTRQFVPFLGPMVYTFASILATYLAATAAGSWLYRKWVTDPTKSWLFDVRLLSIFAAVTALLPLFAADPRWSFGRGLAKGVLRVAIGTGPFCAVLGFLTPMVMDRVSGGEPKRAGFAYALNTIGCIAGPLLAGFVTLPALGERWSLVLLAAPLSLVVLAPQTPAAAAAGALSIRRRLLPPVIGVVTAVLLIVLTRDFESQFTGSVVHRDHTATVVALGDNRMGKTLRINGVGITSLTPITKLMAHLPLAMLEGAPTKGLVLCLGMGTSFRTMLSWGIDATVVELVPSVPALLGFFHPDGDALRASPRAHIVVDDARRYLERSSETFDVIVIDPPPPVEAAASSLLYSVEFYESAAKRLRRGGILQQWLPSGEPSVIASATKALTTHFAHVRIFHSIAGRGWHFLASAAPIPAKTAAELAAKLPPAAAADLVEWGPHTTPAEQLDEVVGREVPLAAVLAAAPDAPALSDDRPVNEYYMLRRLWR